MNGFTAWLGSSTSHRHQPTAKPHQSGVLKRRSVQAFAGLATRGHEAAVIWVLEANPSRFFYQAMGGNVVAERTERFAGTTLAELAYGWEQLHSAA